MPVNKIPCNFKFLDCQHATSSGTQNWDNSTNVFINCSMIEIVSILIMAYSFEELNNRVVTTLFSVKYLYSHVVGTPNS
jgi:hypothetical protein